VFSCVGLTLFLHAIAFGIAFEYMAPLKAHYACTAY